MLNRIVESGFARYNEKKDKYTLLGWSRVNNTLFQQTKFKQVTNRTTGTKLCRYFPATIPNIKELELVRFTQLLVQLNQQFQYNYYSTRKVKSNYAPKAKTFVLSHQDHSPYEFEDSVEYMRLKGGYSNKMQVHRLKSECIRKGLISITPSLSITNLTKEQVISNEFQKYNPQSHKYKVIMNEVYKVGTDKIRLNLKRIFGTTKDGLKLNAVLNQKVSTGKKEKKVLTERQQRFLINAEANKGMLVHHQVLPASFLYKKIGVNMINSIIQKSLENGYEELMKWISNDDVIRIKKKQSVVRYEETYYGGWDKRKVFDTIYVDRFILKD